MLVHKTSVRVRYADTDQMHYAYNGKFFEYFEVGRTEMMRENNLPYKKIEENGFQMPVYETYIKFINPALYDELLEIETKVEKLPVARVHIDHTIRSQDRNIIIAEGYVELVFINKENKKISRAPEFFMKAIKHYFK
ncbi:MAG TPA: thioesterase family protein [Ignavibacteriaceae bacterium]|jgi:acyl-CoA thioester hydrolase